MYALPDPTIEDSIFLSTLHHQEGVEILLEGRVPTATVEVGERKYAITYHALERFMERSEGKNERQRKSLRRIQ